MVVSKNYAINSFSPVSIKRAPPSYYFLALSIGLVFGGVMEWTIIKSDYYQVIKDSELRARVKVNEDQAFYKEYLEKQANENKVH